MVSKLWTDRTTFIAFTMADFWKISYGSCCFERDFWFPSALSQNEPVTHANAIFLFLARCIILHLRCGNCVKKPLVWIKREEQEQTVVFPRDKERENTCRNVFASHPTNTFLQADEIRVSRMDEVSSIRKPNFAMESRRKLPSDWIRREQILLWS